MHDFDYIRLREHSMCTVRMLLQEWFNPNIDAPPDVVFCPLLKKNLKIAHTLSFLSYPNFLLRMLPWKKIYKFSFAPSQSTFVLCR